MHTVFFVHFAFQNFMKKKQDRVYIPSIDVLVQHNDVANEWQRDQSKIQLSIQTMAPRVIQAPEFHRGNLKIGRDNTGAAGSQRL